MHTLILFLCISTSLVYCTKKHKPEQGIFQVELKDTDDHNFFKTLYNNSNIEVKFNSTSEKCKNKDAMYLNVTVIGINCKGELQNNKSLMHKCIHKPESCYLPYYTEYLHTYFKIKCGKTGGVNFDGLWTVVKNIEENPVTPVSRKKRADKETTVHDHTIAPPAEKIASDLTANSTTTTTAQVRFLGEFVVSVSLLDDKKSNISSDVGGFVQLTVEMKSSLGYLSAHEYPLLNFYLIMCIVYSIYTLLWLILSACNCRDLLRVQYWISFVIILGLMEKIVYFAEYWNVNNSGLSNLTMEKFAGFVACLKRTVSRLLVIIVSLGFGIVKPRLGSNLYKVLGVGLIYFVVALLIKMLEIDVYFNAGTREALLFLYTPLVVIDVVIVGWIFTSLLETMKTLRLRRNMTKLSLYRHFSNIIVLCTLVSLGMIVYIVFDNELGCSKNFVNEWFKTACWPLLFSVILFVIMILWRPTANNKRYAYSPMVDGNDSDEEDVVEPMLGNGVTENIKIRSMKSNDLMKTDIDMTEENLKWIDENIPPTVADAALPVIMDSEDVKKAIKYEMSKMD